MATLNLKSARITRSTSRTLAWVALVASVPIPSLHAQNAAPRVRATQVAPPTTSPAQPPTQSGARSASPARITPQNAPRTVPQNAPRSAPTTRATPSLIAPMIQIAPNRTEAPMRMAPQSEATPQTATLPGLGASTEPATTADGQVSAEEMRQRPSLEDGLSGPPGLTTDTALGRYSTDPNPERANMSPNGSPRTEGLLVPKTEGEDAAVNAGKPSSGSLAAGMEGGAEGSSIGQTGQSEAQTAGGKGPLGALSPFVILTALVVVGGPLSAMLWMRRSKSKR